MAQPTLPAKSTTPDDLERLREEYARRHQEAGGQQTYTLFNPGHLFLTQQRQRAILALLRREGLAPLTGNRILELGCGSGDILRELLWYGATPEMLHGTDLLFWRLSETLAATPHLPITNADGQHLPYQNHCFDLVAQFTVFSSILDDRIKQAIAAEMLRVVKPNGLILWYDFWLNPVNPQTRGIRPAEIRSLFPHCHYSFQRITLAPPLARRLSPYFWQACTLLEKFRLFNTHYLAAIQPL